MAERGTTKDCQKSNNHDEGFFRLKLQTVELLISTNYYLFSFVTSPRDKFYLDVTGVRKRYRCSLISIQFVEDGVAYL